jgi:hypothetical protein
MRHVGYKLPADILQPVKLADIAQYDEPQPLV